jgi:hypothetical protein
MALSTARYFGGGSAGGSAQYVSDAGGDEQHCVRDADIAYHAPPNQGSIGLEICGEVGYTRDQWCSPQVWPGIVKCAWRCTDLCARFGIPIVKLSPADLLAGAHGIAGHADVSAAWGETNHTDPGPNFPWDLFIPLVQGAGLPTGVIMGKFNLIAHVVDPKSGLDTKNRVPFWGCDAHGNIYALNGARGIRGLGALGIQRNDIAGMERCADGNGVILFAADDGGQDGPFIGGMEWVASTFVLRVGA